MKKFLLFSLSLVYAFIVYAGPVTEDQALAKASQFMPGKAFLVGNLSYSKAGTKSGSNAPYYVFNAQDNSGFVIVSGDDRTKAILGYSEKGSLNVNKLPENVEAWLEYYAEAISSLEDIPMEGEPNIATATTRTNVTPLIKTEWSQESPWNDQCTFGGTSCVTGCVATAMAQVMNFHKYPSKSKAIDGYTCNYTIPALPAVTFSWKNMCNTYSYYDERTSTQKKAVATLMRYCGQSVEMNYGPGGSSASTGEVSVALVKYFGYSKSTHAVYSDGYSPEGWEDEIYKELAAGYPIVYSGRSKTNYGHAFVVDGYKNGLFHVNWGWGGWCDGYFVLTVMDSHGKNDINNTYSEEQCAIIGIRPTTGGTLDYPLMTVVNFDLQSGNVVTRGSANDQFSVTISAKWQNSVNSTDEKAGFGIALFKGNTMMKSLLQFPASEQSPRYYNYGTYGCSFGSGLDDGTYKIQAVYIDKDGKIYKAQGSDYRYIKAVVKGNKVTMTNYPLVGTVKLSKSKVSVKKGKTVTLTATVSPSTLADKSVTWKSSDTKVATVTEDGKVKGVKYGTATITCTSSTGLSATCKVTVGGVVLDKTVAYVKKSKTVTLTPTIYPTTLTDKSVTWKSSDETVATVSTAGKVKGIKYGTATITCTSNATGLSTTCKVTVGNVTLSKSAVAIKKGKSLTLTAKVYPSTLTDKSVKWESSNTKYATVSSDGKVTGVKVGTATITCTSVATGLSTTCKVTIGAVTLDQKTVAIKKGKTVTLTPTVYPSSLEDKSVTWKSSDETVATVSTEGKVKGIKYGTATITCTSNATGLSATCKVTVGNVKLDQTEATVVKGKTVTLKATVYPSTLTDNTVTWESSNSAVATVSTAGKVKGIKAGTATITCTSVATGLSTTCKITVTASSGTRSIEGDDDDDTTGIDELDVDPAEVQPFDVYDLSGRKVAHQVTSLEGLPNGIYIVNGKKMLKK